MDIVTLALAKKYVKESLAGAGALKGDKGEKGDAFTYADFTEDQLAALTGPQGPKGETGIQGPRGEAGVNGIDGARGDKGEKGDPGVQGEKGDPFTYNDFTAEQLAALKGAKGDTGATGQKGEKGDSYTITRDDYNAIAALVNVPDTEIGEVITVNNAIGGISAGTTFSANTSVADILRALLTTKEVISESSIYVGVSSTIPTSIEGLRAVATTRDALLANGYTYKNITTNDQYVVLAIPKAFGLLCYNISTNGFGLGFSQAEIGNFYVYYDSPSTASGMRYTYSFEEE